MALLRGTLLRGSTSPRVLLILTVLTPDVVELPEGLCIVFGDFMASCEGLG